MTLDNIAPETLKLSLQDRVKLATSLWESIEDPSDLAVELCDEDAIPLMESTGNSTKVTRAPFLDKSPPIPPFPSPA